MSNKKRGTSKLGPLAEQLKDLKLDLGGKTRRPEPDTRAPEPAARPEPTPRPSPKPAPELSDEELFEMALDKLDPSRIFQAKYQGEASAELPPDPTRQSGASRSERADTRHDPQAEEEARQQVFEARDAAIFMRAVSGVEMLEPDRKYRPQHGKHREARQVDTEREESLPDNGLITPSLPRDDEGLSFIEPLGRAQRALIKRYQQVAIGQRTGQINLRGDTLDDALRQLELYIHQWWKSDQARFVRVIHGRGIHSEEGPVLKPAVLEWLEGPGLRYVRGYAPERSPEGDYGSLIVELLEAKSVPSSREGRGSKSRGSRKRR
ncbi:hypothetical protein DL240_16335 [Lujinxingia litoralis]|uniref:Smr domain-containing protein n=1 Tax=Lujinxingia litoralis TaxID=2211119 RepID=A0A328C4D6_9DELT|nr:Smr/MutS family protein [Lujinxingia litoralis]RAL20598.1 hypothetical protein DL240_16335 [Lujinxingia litoralis]